MATSYDQGDTVRLTATFGSAPSAVVFQVRQGSAPGQNITTPAVTTVSSTVRRIDYVIPAAGYYAFRVRGTGTATLVSLTAVKQNTVAVGNLDLDVGGSTIAVLSETQSSVVGSNLDAGDTLRVDMTFTSGGVNTDPAAVTVSVCAGAVPGVTSALDTVYTFGVGGVITKLGTGIFRADVPMSQVGSYRIRVRGTNVPDVAVTAARVGTAAVGEGTLSAGVCHGNGDSVTVGAGGASATFYGSLEPMPPFTVVSNVTDATAQPVANTADDVLEVLLRDGRVKVFSEDFWSLGSGYLSGNDAVGTWHWTNRNSDDGPWRGIASETNHPGIAQVEMTSAPGTISVSASGTFGSEVPLIDIADVAWLRVVARIPDITGTAELTNTTYGVGLIQAGADANLSGETPVYGGNGIALFKRASVSQWQCRTADGGLGFTQSLVVATVGNWVEMLAIQTSAGVWDIYANGAFDSTLGGPASALVYPAFWISSTGSGQKRFDVDLFELGVRFSGNRYT